MNQLKIAFTVLLVGVFSSGCYTIVYNTAGGDVFYEEPTPPPPLPPPPRPPHPNPPYYPPQPIIIVPAPVKPPPPKYITRPPGNKQRDPGVVDPKRNGGGRGNDGGRR